MKAKSWATHLDNEIDDRPGTATRRARERGGPCRCCGFPLSDRHHLIPFADFGDLYLGESQMVDLCPNCHRCFHHYWNLIEIDQSTQPARWIDYVNVLWTYEPILRVLDQVLVGNRQTAKQAVRMTDLYGELYRECDDDLARRNQFALAHNRFVKIEDECGMRAIIIADLYESRHNQLQGQQQRAGEVDASAPTPSNDAAA